MAVPGLLVEDAASDLERGAPSIRMYLDQISRFSLLTAQEELKLARVIEAKPLRDALRALGVIGQIDERRRTADELLPEILDRLPRIRRTRQRAELSRELLGVNDVSHVNGRREAALQHFSSRVDEIERARRRLTEANLRLVVSNAKRYVGRGLSLLDLIQEGNLGLIRAVEGFDHRRGCRFSTYATWWIRQSMRRAIADHARVIRLPVHLDETLNRLVRASQLLYQELGREPAEEEIADELAIGPHTVRNLLMYAQTPASLDAPIDEMHDDRLVDLVEDRAAVCPPDAVVVNMLRSDVEDALDALTPRERRVLQLRFGLVDGTPRTLREIGRRFGLGRERIRQIESTALAKLRQPWHCGRLRDYLA